MKPVELHTVFIELTNRCNFDCVFCPNEQMRRPRGTMSHELLIRILDELAEGFKVDHINFHLMGEPFLYRRLDEAIVEAESRGLRVVLNTNCSLLTPKRVEAVLDAAPSILVLSYQTPDDELFELRKARKLTYQQYMQQIKDTIRRKFEKRNNKTTIELHVLNTRQLNPRISVMETDAQVQAILHEWIEFGRQLEAEFGLEPLEHRPSVMAGCLDSPMDRLYEIAANVSIRFKGSTSFGHSVVEPGLKLIEATEGACPVEPQLGILWNGDCTMCCLDYDGQIKLGNLYQVGSLAHIWQGEKAVNIRRNFGRGILIEPFCQRCQGRLVADTPSTSLPDRALNLLLSLYRSFRKAGGRAKRLLTPMKASPLKPLRPEHPYSHRLVELNAPQNMRCGQTAQVHLKVENTGYENWYGVRPDKRHKNYGQALNLVELGTFNPMDHNSIFYTAGSWVNERRPNFLEQETVLPHETGTFSFEITAPDQPGSYRESLQLVCEGVSWFVGPPISFTVEVE